MIKIENTQVVGWEHAIRGMRNPKNSWDRMDSCVCDPDSDNCDHCARYVVGKMDEECGDIPAGDFVIGPNDQKLMMSLAKGGPVHAKYRRMITVYVDITAPLYWWKEFDTYKIGTVANSCSTMHKIHDKELTLDDFSHEHLLADERYGWDDNTDIEVLRKTIDHLNYWRDVYNNGRERHAYSAIDDSLKPKSKYAFDRMIQLLPSSYNQKRTIMLNYEVLAGIYPMRRNHKLDEWRVFCDWIEGLPYSEIITGPKMLNKKMNVPEDPDWEGK